MPGPHTAPSDTPAPRAALVALAAALDPREFAVTLTTRPGRRACLSVTSGHAAIGDDITADPAAYWWSWGERIGPLHDPPPPPARSAPCCERYPSPPMGDPGALAATRPGPDEIVLSAPAAGQLCSSLQHRRADCPPR